MTHRHVSRASRLATALAAGALVVGLAAGPALAGEVTGTGVELAHNGASICQFSGLNDDPNGAFPEGGRVQSYGYSVVRNGLKPLLDSFGINPGVECNPNSGH